MLKIVKVAQTQATDDYLKLDAEKQAPVMERVLDRLGIEIQTEYTNSAIVRIYQELKNLYAKAAEHGITHGRLTMRLPEGWKLRDALTVFDNENFRPDCIDRTVIHGEYSRNAVGELIRQGLLDAKGYPGKVEFRVLPCATGYKTRTHDGRMLEPVGLFYNETESSQKRLFARYKKAYKALNVEYATPLEVLLSAMIDRECACLPKSDYITFNCGLYRTTIWAPNATKDSRLCVDSCHGQLRLGLVQQIGAQANLATVASIGA